MKVKCMPLFADQAGKNIVLHGVTKIVVELGKITFEQGAAAGWHTFPDGTQQMAVTITEEET